MHFEVSIEKRSEEKSRPRLDMVTFEKDEVRVKFRDKLKCFVWPRYGETIGC